MSLISTALCARDRHLMARDAVGVDQGSRAVCHGGTPDPPYAACMPMQILRRRHRPHQLPVCVLEVVARHAPSSALGQRRSLAHVEDYRYRSVACKAQSERDENSGGLGLHPHLHPSLRALQETRRWSNHPRAITHSTRSSKAPQTPFFTAEYTDADVLCSCGVQKLQG